MSSTSDERYICHRWGSECSWDGCPRRYDQRACEGCFLIPGPGNSPQIIEASGAEVRAREYLTHHRLFYGSRPQA